MTSKSSQYHYTAFSKLFLLGTVVPALVLLPIDAVGFSLPKLLLFSITATVGTIWLLLREDLTALNIFREHRLGQLMLYFALVLLLSMTWSITPIISTLGAAPRFGGLLTYGVCFGFTVCAICLCQHPEGRRYLVMSIILSNAVIAGYGFFQLIRLDPLSYLWTDGLFYNRTFSLVGQPNALGAFLLLTFPFVGFKALNAKPGGPERFLYWLLTIANILVLLSTASRAAILGLAVNLTVFSIIAWPIVKSVLKKAVQRFAVGTILIVFLCTAVAIFSFQDRFTAGNDPLRSSTSRLIIWRDIGRMIQDRPQGYGLEAIPLMYPSYRSAALFKTEALTAVVDRSHSLPLDLLAALGPLGLLTYYGFIATLLGAAWRLRATSGSVAAGGLGILGYSTAMLFGFETVLTQIFFWFIAGLIMGITWQVEKGRKKQADFMAARVGVVVLCILCVSSSVVSTQWIRGRLRLELANWLDERDQVNEALKEYANASQEFVYDRDIIIQLTETLLRAREFEQTQEVDAVLDQVIGDSIESLNLLTRGNDGYIPLFRGWHAAINQNVTAVRQNISAARKLMPNTIDTYRISAHSFLLVGDTPAALDSVRSITQYLPSNWRTPEDIATRMLWRENPWLEELKKAELVLRYRQVQNINAS